MRKSRDLNFNQVDTNFMLQKTCVNEKKESKHRTKKKLLLTYVHICHLVAIKICIIIYKHTNVKHNIVNSNFDLY